MDTEGLSPQLRAQHYRECARVQLDLAASAGTAEIRAACLELAGLWTRLAEAAEHETRAAAPDDRRDRERSAGA